MWDKISLWFWFAFIWWLVMLSIFSRAYQLSVWFLLGKKIVYSFTVPIFNWNFLLLNFVSSLYTSDINLLSAEWLQIFSPIQQIASIFCWWFPLPYRFIVLVWYSPTLFVVVVVVFIFCVKSKKEFLRPMSRNFLPVCSSGNFMVSGEIYFSVYTYVCFFVLGLSSPFLLIPHVSLKFIFAVVLLFLLDHKIKKDRKGMHLDHQYILDISM